MGPRFRGDDIAIELKTTMPPAHDPSLTSHYVTDAFYRDLVEAIIEAISTGLPDQGGRGSQELRGLTNGLTGPDTARPHLPPTRSSPGLDPGAPARQPRPRHAPRSASLSAHRVEDQPEVSVTRELTASTWHCPPASRFSKDNDHAAKKQRFLGKLVEFFERYVGLA